MTDNTSSDSRLPLFVDPLMLMDEPHAHFASLRSEHPVLRLGDNHYMLLRGEDVVAMLTDPRTKQIDGPDYVRLNQIPDGATARFLGEFFLFGNGEQHRAKRSLFARSFSRGAIYGVHDQIRAVADSIVDELPRDEVFDFVDLMAARVPAYMIASILGLPRSEAPYFAARVYDVARALTAVYPRDDHEQIEASTRDLYTYVEGHLHARLEAPEQDLLSMLVADWQADQVIPFESLVNQVVGIIIGGSDTTRAAFAILVATLLEHPEQWAAVKAEPELIPGAILEGMRYDPSVGTIARIATEPVEIGDATLPAGTILRLSTMSALRDPALYTDPDRFDIRRSDHPRLHPVFGLGPHRCIGAMLAQLEMQESLAALIDAELDIELETPPQMIGFGGIRQISPMMVRLH